MSDQILTIVSWLFLGLGSFFYLVGAFGLFRMPDVFTRMHAVSVSDTLGVGFLIAGMAIETGWSLNTARLIIILAIMLYSGPIATHALAQAALHAGVKPKLSDDRLKKSRRISATRKIAGSGSVKAKAAAPAKSRSRTTRKSTNTTRGKATSSKGRGQSSKR
ncbi:MAG: monovalent cation/H(+) antiporter subunit G [Rhizobiales bacterium]|nr:monovalent cation/H(+) antiporter subunit G [Hyphomicrobiales bacterium]